MSDAPACDQKHAEFCTGKDVRPIRMKVNHGNGRFTFDGPRANWCKGCREFQQGQFKYDK